MNAYFRKNGPLPIKRCLCLFLSMALVLCAAAGCSRPVQGPAQPSGGQTISGQSAEAANDGSFPGEPNTAPGETLTRDSGAADPRSQSPAGSSAGDTADGTGTAPGDSGQDPSAESSASFGETASPGTGPNGGSTSGTQAAEPESPALYDPQTLLASQEAAKAFESLCNQFLQEQLSGSYLNLHYSLLDPEAYGITDYPVSFGDFSLTAMQEERRQQRMFQKQLADIDPGLLNEDDQLTYRILQKALLAEEAGDGLELYYEPLAASTGVQAQLPILLAEFTFREKQDIEDYLTLLSSIDDYYAQILAFEQEKAAAGLFMTDGSVTQIADGCAGYLLPAESNFMTTTFNQRIDAFEGLTDRQREKYKTRNLKIVQSDFIPAYQQLLDGLNALKGSCTNEQGLSYFPDGRAYYEYLVFAGTGVNYDSVKKLRDDIADQIDSELSAMSRILAEHPETAGQILDYSFGYTEPKQILEHLADQIQKDFPAIPDCHYETKFVPDELSLTLGPAFFLVPPIDDYDDCVIYINPDSTSDSQALYTTLAHEGLPGHMYQNTYFLAHCTNNLRKVLSFTSYSEGWATYVENYSYTTDNGLSPALGQLLAHNASANLGLHALLDINIHYFGWTMDQVSTFLEPYFDVSQTDVVQSLYQVMLNAPTNYLDYYAGYLEILHMRDQAMETLGERFVLKDFHQFLLDTGPAPYTVICEEFQKWLEEQA